MRQASTPERVCEVIEGMIGCDPVTPSDLKRSDLLETLKLDSLDLIELTMALEEEFNVSIPDDEADKYLPSDIGKTKPLSDLVKFIDARIEEKAI